MADHGNPSSEHELRLYEAIAAYYQAREAGESLDRAAFLARYPDLAGELAAFLDNKAAFEKRAGGTPLPASEAETLGPSPTLSATTPLGKVGYFGDYELLAEIARGGMGVVYRARQVSLNRPVALKMILSGQLASPADVQRFLTEAEAAANLDHPHIVPIYEVGEHIGQHYFSMKLLEGGSLAEFKDHLRSDARAAARLVQKAARAVHYAHQRGLLHRDLKPANILLDAKGEPHVTDFGLAKRVEGGSNLTQSGAIVGTPSYMAPEQARAEKGLSTAVDTYSLGAILYELLTGQPPFRAATPLDTVLQVLDREPVAPRTLDPRVDRDLQTICLKCLEKDPKRRYDSAEALADDLERWLCGEPIRARPVGVGEKAVKWVKRRPVVAGLLAGLVLVAAVSGVLVAGSYREALRQSQIARDERSEALRQSQIARDERDGARRAEDNERAAKVRTQDALEVNKRALTTSKIAQANVALRDHDPKLGLSLLENCPLETRFWEWHYSHRLCRGAPLTLHPDGEFYNAVFSPDGLWIAAHDRRGLILFDARTGAEQGRGPSIDWQRQVTFSPDSCRVAAFSPDSSVLKVWQVPAGKEVTTIPTRNVARWAPVVFSPNGQWLACAGVDNTTTVWDAHTGKQKFAVPFKIADGSKPVQLAYTPDGASLAVYDGEEVRFLDPLTGKEQRKFTARGFDADFSPDGRHLALKTETATICVLDLDTGSQLWQIPMESGTMAAVLKYSPDGERLAFMVGGGRSPGWALDNVRLFDAATGKLLATLPNKQWEQMDHPYSLSFSGDGQRLAVVHSKAVEVWNVRDLTDGVTLRGHTDTILDQAFSPDGRQLLTVANSAAPAGIPLRGWLRPLHLLTTVANSVAPAGIPGWEVKRWDVDGGIAVATLPGHAAPLFSAAFNGKADRVAVGGSDNTVRICDTATGRELLLVGLEGLPTDLAFSPDGGFLAVLVQEEDGSRILILDAASGRQRRVIAPGKHLGALALSPDGQSVAGAVLVTVPPRELDLFTATPATLERIQVWSVATGEEKWRASLPSNRVDSTALAFSQNGRWLAGNTTDRTVTLWDAQTGAEHLQFKVPAGDVAFISALAFSADSERLATGGGYLVKVWDTHTGQEVYSFKSMEDQVVRLAFRADNLALAVARVGKSPTVALLSAETVPSRPYLEGSTKVAVFSPDGRRVAAAGAENDILLFDAFTGQRVQRLEGHVQPIAALVFSEAKRLLSASIRDDDPQMAIWGRMSLDLGLDVKEVKVWDLETANQVALIGNLDKKVAGLDLSADGSCVAVVFGELDISKGTVKVHELRVWDLAGSRLRHAIRCDISQFEGLAFAENGKVVAIRNRQGEVVGWSVETGDSAPVVGDPFARPKRDRHTEDGRHLWSSNGKFFIQPEPDDRQRERLRAQGRPDPAWHADKARSAEAGKQWFAASFHLGRLLLESPDNVDLLCRRARAYIGLSRWPEARVDCDAAIRLQPKSVEAWVTHGLLEYRQGRLEQAHADLARAAGLAPDEPAVAAWQAFLYVMDKQEEKAAAAERRMLHQLPFLLGVTGNRSEVALRDPKPLRPSFPAWTMLHEELTQCLATNGKAVPLLRLRGVVWTTQSMNQAAWLEAFYDLQKVATLAPKDVVVRKNLACVIWQTQWRIFGGAPKQGLEACDAVLRLDPQAWEFWYLRGLFCALDRQQAPALEAYTRALELHPDFVPALRERGTAHAELGQWAEAVADLARATELTGPTEPPLWDALALAQLGRGDTAAYQKTCTHMLEMFGRPSPLIWASGAFAVGPDNPCGAALALRVADQAIQQSGEADDVTAVRCTSRADTLADWQRLIPLTKHRSPEVRGKVFCRTGRYDEAVKLLVPLRVTPGEAEAVRGGPGGWLGGNQPQVPTALLSLYLTLAEHRRGHTADAKQLLKETIDWLDKPALDNPKQKNSDQLQWKERVEIDQLRREVEGILKNQVP